MYRNTTGRSWNLWARQPKDMTNAVLRAGRQRAADEQELSDKIQAIKALEKALLTARERRETLEKELNEALDTSDTEESTAADKRRAEVLKRCAALNEQYKAAWYKEDGLQKELEDERYMLGVIRQKLK
jgi:predicted  nucleic acid-binding Zn-ribbon protein